MGLIISMEQGKGVVTTYSKIRSLFYDNCTDTGGKTYVELLSFTTKEHRDACQESQIENGFSGGSYVFDGFLTFEEAYAKLKSQPHWENVTDD